MMHIDNFPVRKGRDFPGGPVVETLCFHHRGTGSLVRELRFCMLHVRARKKKREIETSRFI